MRTAATTAALLLLLACSACSSVSARPVLGGGLLRGASRQPACPQGAAPASIDVGGLKAVGANGVIELSWQAVPCATSYAVLVDREDVPPEQDNELSFNVTVPRAVVQNVANGSPYVIEIVACNGPLCSGKVGLRVTPSGQVAPSMTIATMTAMGGGAAPTSTTATATAAVVTMPSAFGTMPALGGTQWRVVMRQQQQPQA